MVTYRTSPQKLPLANVYRPISLRIIANASDSFSVIGENVIVVPK